MQQLRDLLQAEGLAEKTDSGRGSRTLDSVLGDGKAGEPAPISTKETAAWTVKPADNRDAETIPHACCIGKRDIRLDSASSS